MLLTYTQKLCISVNMTLLGIGKSVIQTDCHINRWFSVYAGQFGDFKNCRIKLSFYYMFSYNPILIGTVFGIHQFIQKARLLGQTEYVQFENR